MTFFQKVKTFFGFGQKRKVVMTEEDGRRVFHVDVGDMPVAEAAAKINMAIEEAETNRLEAAKRRKRTTNPKQFYRRGGKYYNVGDDSLIDDLLLIYVLTEMFSDGDIQEYEDMPTEEANVVTEDLVDMDVSDTPVEAFGTTTSDAYSYPTPPGPAYEPYVAPEPEPEPTERYSSGSSYGGGSSDYDSGSSDSGGGSDD